MFTYRADGVVKALSWWVSAAYYLSLVAMVGLMFAYLVVRLSGARLPDMTTHVAVEVDPAGVVLKSKWTPSAPIEVAGLTGEAEIPISSMPFGIFALMWVGYAVCVFLMLYFLHQLRMILRRVRAGAPFDADNARRMRTMGLLLLSILVVKAVVVFAVGMAVMKSFSDTGGARVVAGFHIDGIGVFMGLVLIMLAEIFRRGSALEDEQALVV